ncbi:MAG: HAD-IA family hydrolase [Cellvibrionaceae bacterium]
MSIKAVFFDLDGTLLDTAPDFLVTMQQLTDEYNAPRISNAKIRQTVSDGARALTTLAFQLTEKEDGFEERRQRLLDIYYQHMGKHCVLFDGMEALLQQIKNQQLFWGIITNKPYRFSEPIVDNLNLPNRPNLLICPDHVSKTKPDAEPLILACNKVGCKPEEAIYIGDHKRDIDCGINAGSKTIAVSFGYIHEDDKIEEWQADHIAEHADDIWPIIHTYL